MNNINTNLNLTAIPFYEDRQSHYKNLSTASHEISNYAATLGSTYQYLDVKYPETHSFKFWQNLGSSIDNLCLYMKQTAVCRRCHFPEKTDTDLDTIAEAVRECFDENGCVHVSDCTDISVHNTGTPLYGDPDQIAAAVYQLIMNAYEAQSEDSAGVSVPHIAVSLYEEPENSGSVHISVTNTGSLPAEYTPARLAEAFFSTKPNHSGTGLYIASLVCTMHDGMLSLGSDGKTTAAVMTLSLKRE